MWGTGSWTGAAQGLSWELPWDSAGSVLGVCTGGLHWRSTGPCWEAAQEHAAVAQAQWCGQQWPQR